MSNRSKLKAPSSFPIGWHDAIRTAAAFPGMWVPTGCSKPKSLQVAHHHERFRAFVKSVRQFPHDAPELARLLVGMKLQCSIAFNETKPHSAYPHDIQCDSEIRLVPVLEIPEPDSMPLQSAIDSR